MAERLADRIRSEAEVADRPGQMARLEAIADEVERLQRGAHTLGHTIEQQGRMILDITGLHHFIGADGDGDWGAVWENAYELLPRIELLEKQLQAATPAGIQVERESPNPCFAWCKCACHNRPAPTPAAGTERREGA